MRLIVIMCSILFLSSCSENYDDQLNSLAKHVGKKSLGNSKDYWLVKENMLGQWDKTVLIFGYMDDFDFCNELAAMYMAKHPLDKYICMAAN